MNSSGIFLIFADGKYPLPMIFIQQHLGESAALLTALLWAFTAIFFELAGKQIGSLQVNLFRLIFALVLLTIFNHFYRGMAWPNDASTHQWIWLIISGLVGFVFGDLLLFKAYVLVGSRISMLIMALAPFFSAISGRIMLNEVLSVKSLLGMFVTFFGIILVVLGRKKNAENTGNDSKFFSFALKHNPQGLLFALGGAFGQGFGLVLSKYGMQGFDPFASTQIRIIAGVSGFSLVFLSTRRWQYLKEAVKKPKAIYYTLAGSVFGPFLGVSLSLLAVKYTSAGIAATLMSIVPVIIIVPAALIFKEKIAIKEVVGSLISTGGVALFFL